VFCQVDNEVVPREDLVRAAQVSKEGYVQITDQEFGARSEANRMIDVKEFVPLESVDPVYFETAIISDPTKAEKKPYRLLAGPEGWDRYEFDPEVYHL
jgi:DNA end-binding protein Ku